MKAIFIAYDQAHHEAIVEILTKNNCRGYTAFGNVLGRGSNTGDPHYGSHAWPSLAGGILTMVDDRYVDDLLEKFRQLDLAKPLLGLRAFVWNVEKTI